VRNEHLKNIRQRAFLAAFAECGCISIAARAAQISRRSHYVWLKRDPDYKAAFKVAWRWGYDSLRDEAVRRAMGYDVPVYYRGKKIGTNKIYSDRLLIALLEGNLNDRHGLQHLQGRS
jgi:hypothetical protein